MSTSAAFANEVPQIATSNSITRRVHAQTLAVYYTRHSNKTESQTSPTFNPPPPFPPKFPTMSGSHLSRDFFALVKAIGESKSKQEEDRIILGEIQTLKKILSGGKGSDNGSAGSAKKKAKEVRRIW